jgi:tripartite ATP-independent transporter DctP family solute receptor
MIHRRSWFRTLLAGVFLAALSAFGAEAQIVRVAHHHAVGGIVDLTANRFATQLRERSGGRINARVFPAAQLGQEREAYDLLNSGAIDVTFTSTGIMDKVYQPIEVTSLPFIFRDWGHARRALNGEFGRTLTTNVRNASNTEVLAYFGLGFRDMMFRGDPVPTLAGMTGVRMRSPESFVFIRMFELMGARPTPVTWGEVYMAMQTGVAAGLESPAALALDMKFNEVTRSLVQTRHMFAVMAINMNKARFARYSEADQAMIRQLAVEAGTWAEDTMAIPQEQSAYETLRQRGLRVVEASNPQAWSDAMRPLWAEIRGRTPDAGRLIDLLVETR